MDPERIVIRPQPETTSPTHGASEEKSGTIQVDPFNPSRPDTARTDTRNPPSGNLLSSASSEKSVINETVSLHHPSNIYDHLEKTIQPPLSVRLPESNSVGRRDSRNRDTGRFSNTMMPAVPNVDWIVPTGGKPAESHTVGDRLQPTLDIAIVESDRYALKAKWTAYALNTAIGAQVLLGSLTTGLSALAVSGGKSTATATTALGALATLVASYLARARGSNEPELSITRHKDLDQFIRECRAFQLDHGHVVGNAYDAELLGFRRRFEELLGNANGERKLSPPA